LAFEQGAQPSGTTSAGGPADELANFSRSHDPRDQRLVKGQLELSGRHRLGLIKQRPSG
jgi:hypothetical protein